MSIVLINQVEFYLQSGECAECRCYIPGSEDDICDVSSGKCDCMTGYEGDKCFMCQVKQKQFFLN